MKKKLIIRDYNNSERIIEVPECEKVIMYNLQFRSGDAILYAIYKDKVLYWDSSTTRKLNFDDGDYYILPKNIDKINEIKNNYTFEDNFSLEIKEGK